jgi:hypothetical protein
VLTAYIAAAVVGLILAVAFSPSPDRLLARRLAGRKRLALVLAELGATGAAYRRRPGVVLLGIAMGMVTYSLHTLSFAAAAHALTPDAPGLVLHFLIVPLVLFSTAIPLPGGALGVSENVSDRLFRMAGSSGGLVAMLAFRTYVYATAIIGAGLYLANLAQVRTLAASAEHLAEGLEPEPEPLVERTSGETVPPGAGSRRPTSRPPSLPRPSIAVTRPRPGPPPAPGCSRGPRTARRRRPRAGGRARPARAGASGRRTPRSAEPAAGPGAQRALAVGLGSMWWAIRNAVRSVIAPPAPGARRPRGRRVDRLADVVQQAASSNSSS